MNADLEDTIEVDDLPNFRLEGAPTFDVDASASGAAGEVYTAETLELPEVIRLFVVYFRKQLQESNVYEVHSIYEATFNKLTDRFYKTTPWPSAETISPLVAGDQTFLLLYKELYYRHIYSKLQPTWTQRVESWNNYCAVFDLILGAATPDAVPQLPNQWLWDIVDEFIYQFQTFCQFRQRLRGKSEDEVTALKSSPEVWAVERVLDYLQQLAAKSEAAPFSSSPMYTMTGYFARVGLLRMHCLLADYRMALKTVEGFDLAKKGLFTKVTSCHISVFYYVSFAYLMSRRYVDAIKTLSAILFYIGRTKQYHTRSYQFDQIIKKNEQMYAMLAIALSLCPQGHVDENIASTLKDKYGDRMLRMQSNHLDTGAFEELFAFSCPKFVSPAPPDFNAMPDTVAYGAASREERNPQEAYRLQLKLLLNEVKQQTMLPTIRSFLKLYTTIDVAKLAALLEGGSDEAECTGADFREHLQCLKHKTHARVHGAGAPLSGDFASTADVDFFVDGDMAHVADASSARRHSDYFVRQIAKLDDIMGNLMAPSA